MNKAVVAVGLLLPLPHAPSATCSKARPSHQHGYSLLVELCSRIFLNAVLHALFTLGGSTASFVSALNELTLRPFEILRQTPKKMDIPKQIKQHTVSPSL